MKTIPCNARHNVTADSNQREPGPVFNIHIISNHMQQLVELVKSNGTDPMTNLLLTLEGEDPKIYLHGRPTLSQKV